MDLPHFPPVYSHIQRKFDTAAMTHDWNTLFPYLRQVQHDAPWLLEAIQALSLPAGTITFHQGDSCANYLLVVEGSIKVIARSPSGREIVLYRVRPGGSCVLTTSCLLSGSRYPAEGITESAIRALAIPATVFNRGLANSDAFRNFVFDSYGQRLAEVIALVEDISFGQINQRLARYLDEHADKDNILCITHQDLATELGSAREVISRQLKGFEQRGWLEQQRGKIRLLQPESISQLAQTAM